jgi:ABC-type transporter Mla subunit MlaD
MGLFNEHSIDEVYDLVRRVITNQVRLNANLSELADVTTRKLNKIMASQTEHAEELRGVKRDLDEAFTELTDRIATLEQAIQNAGNTTPEVDEAMAAVKAQAEALKNVVPNPEPEPEP